MNFSEILNEDEDVFMSTYDRLLRLRNMTTVDDEPFVENPLLQSLREYKTEYLSLVDEVLRDSRRLEVKKEKVEKLIIIMDTFGNKETTYAQQLSDIVDQFEKEECVEDLSESVQIRFKRLSQMRKVFELCATTDIMSQYTCFLCLERPVTQFIDVCGHVLCDICSRRNMSISCPFCREPIRQYKKLFLG